MSITVEKEYEVICDGCNNYRDWEKAETKNEAIKKFIMNGWVIKGKRHFCSSQCELNHDIKGGSNEK